MLKTTIAVMHFVLGYRVQLETAVNAWLLNWRKVMSLDPKEHYP